MRDAGSRLLAFRTGSTRLALPLDVVREVIDRPEVVPVPGCREHVSGVTLSGGVALPVYDLRRVRPLWSGGPPGSGEAPIGRSHLIVCGLGEIVLGLQGEDADLLEGAAPADEGVCAVEGTLLRARLSHRGEFVALLDPVRLFTSLGVPAEALSSVTEDHGEEDPARG